MSANVLQLLKTYRSNSKLINEMAKTKRDEFVTYCCYLSGASDGNNDMENIAEETIYLGLPKKQINWRSWKTVWKVAKLIDEKGIDIIVCQFRRTIPIGVYAALLSKRNPKVVGILHGIVSGKVGHLRKIHYWILFKYLSRLVSVSRYGIKDIARLNYPTREGLIIAIQNGLDYTDILSVERQQPETIICDSLKGKIIFGTVGRLSEVKNHRRLIHAFAKLTTENSNAGLVIVGVGPLMDSLQILVRKLGIENEVVFTGFRTDVPKLLQAMDIYVMPSLREGLPLALMEAMAAGLPVITSKHSGMEEVAGHCGGAKLVNPESVDDIYRAMREMYQTGEQQRRAMGEQAKNRALNQFSCERMVAEYQAMYRDVLGKP